MNWQLKKNCFKFYTQNILFYFFYFLFIFGIKLNIRWSLNYILAVKYAIVIQITYPLESCHEIEYVCTLIYGRDTW